MPLGGPDERNGQVGLVGSAHNLLQRRRIVGGVGLELVGDGLGLELDEAAGVDKRRHRDEYRRTLARGNIREAEGLDCTVHGSRRRRRRDDERIVRQRRLHRHSGRRIRAVVDDFELIREVLTLQDRIHRRPTD